MLYDIETEYDIQPTELIGSWEKSLELRMRIINKKTNEKHILSSGKVYYLDTKTSGENARNIAFDEVDKRISEGLLRLIIKKSKEFKLD